MKTCTKCKVEKPRSEFYSDGKGGLKGSCKECCRAKQRRYHEEHRESERERMAGYVRRNKERFRQRDRERYAREPHRVQAWVHQNRARKFGHEITVEDFTHADIAAVYGDACFYCETGAFEQTDHYFPLSLGGHHTLTNVRPSCASCNSRKGNIPGDEFEANKKTPPSRND